MRLRNIPRADEVIAAHSVAIKDERNYHGRWHSEFQNNNPIHIEIGMGKGQFLLTLASRNPEINYIGIERYSSVLLRALEKYDTDPFRELQNVRFICMDAADLPEVFDCSETDRIYLNFSDPWPKARHAKRRLTSVEFLSRYEQILAPGGTVEFKTDNRLLFDFSLEQIPEAHWKLISHSFDLHRDAVLNEGNIMTEYEEKFSSMGNPICKMIAAPSVYRTNLTA